MIIEGNPIKNFRANLLVKFTTEVNLQAVETLAKSQLTLII